MDLHTLIDTLRNSILITGLVITMMLMIEFVNIKSKGSVFNKLKGSKFKQVVISALLGLVPGCIGGFAAVSLYTHRLISFGALIAMMICSSGDEAFVMLSVIPQTALIIFGLLFVIAIISGVVVDRIFTKRYDKFNCNDNYEVHTESDCCMPSIFSIKSYKVIGRLSKERIFLLIGIAMFIGAMLFGLFEHTHSSAHDHGTVTIQLSLLNERWLNVLFAIMSIFTLLQTFVAPDHFVKEHLWDHIVKRHLVSIFTWTFAALFAIHLMMHYWHIEHLIRDNIPLMILLAVAIGVIPESGPHLIFITMFAGGIIPFSVLLTNSIVQDGHTTLPLLAESKSTFIKAKLINMTAGLIVGFLFYAVEQYLQ